MKSLWDCNWSQNLNNDLVDQILSGKCVDIDLSGRNGEDVLCLAISALQAFVQDNFVGPPLDDGDYFKALPWHSIVQTVGIETFRDCLVSDGEEINTNVKHPELLAIAKLILLHLNSNLAAISDPVERFIYQHWLLRYYGVHQLIINENTDTLFTCINNTSESLVNCLNDIDEINQDSKVICLLEIIAWQLHYKRIVKAKEHLQTVQQMLDVSITIEGKLGVRTKYQQKPMPQLMLRVDSPNGDIVVPPIESPVAPIKLPSLLQLDDDVRLERIQFVNEEDNLITRTKSIVQAFILATL